jgi:colicin import membrane protein
MSHAGTLGPGLPTRVEPGKNVSLALTIAVHAALAVFLIYGIHWQTTAPAAVEVELVRAPPAPEPVPVPAPAPVVEPPLAPKVEAKPPPPAPPKPEIAIKEKVKPVKPVPQVTRPKPMPADPFADELRREEERIDQRKAAAAASDELARLKSQQLAAQAASLRDKSLASYKGKIIAKIRGNLVRPPNLNGNPEATFEVIQLPSGEIISARLKRSSGNTTLDDAIMRAILRSSPLPLPDRGDIFSRSLDLSFRPNADD